ncbi:unnamed protein product [Pleuronectes platessa]|uniref:Strictosidine synthase conserved region domain-containing protein n=1 Tax=Pleuronectes platessa TaxID=8262 RepID=A0A9N7TZW9_PLEPL|nr:unnamed protein product [Pleuronectes platessa]
MEKRRKRKDKRAEEELRPSEILQEEGTRTENCTMFSRRSLLVALLSVAVGLYLLPSPIDPKPHVLKGPPPALEGPLAVNTRLQNGRRLFSGELHGPESFTADDDGNVYTGTVDGKLWRIGPDDSLTLITQMGQDLPECGSSPDYEPLCGRPHGVRLDRRGQLIVADSYLGLHSVDPQTGDKTMLLSNSQGADGVPFAFLNGLEISAQTGIIYFTDSSSRWGRRHVKLEEEEEEEGGGEGREGRRMKKKGRRSKKKGRRKNRRKRRRRRRRMKKKGRRRSKKKGRRKNRRKKKGRRKNRRKKKRRRRNKKGRRRRRKKKRKTGGRRRRGGGGGGGGGGRRGRRRGGGGGRGGEGRRRRGRRGGRRRRRKKRMRRRGKEEKKEEEEEEEEGRRRKKKRRRRRRWRRKKKRKKSGEKEEEEEEEEEEGGGEEEEEEKEVIELNRLGRLLTFDPQTGSVRVLLDSLYMPNGVVLSPDEHFLLLAETSIGRILRARRPAPRRSLMDNMIGYPDNIRLSDHGTFLVGMTTPRLRKLVPPFLDAIAPYPGLKRLLAKVVPLSWYGLLLPRYALVLELGPDGELVGSLHDPEGRLTWAISDVFQHRGRTYLGSTDLPFLPVLEAGDS